MMPIERVKFHLKPLVDQILDQLPPHVFTSDRTTFLDPAFGGGQFLREVVTRLRACGHSDDNIRSRIYGCEITNFRVKYAQQLGKVISDNLIKADCLSHDWGDMKFDVILGNPPYQSADSTMSLWPLFVEKSMQLLNEGGHLAMVTPATWMRPSNDIKRPPKEGGSKQVFADFMKVYNTKIIDTGHAKKHFEVGSTITWYVIEKCDYKGVTTVIDPQGGQTQVDLRNYLCYPINADVHTLRLFEKVQIPTTKFDFKGIQGPGRADLECSETKNRQFKYKYVGSRFSQKNYDSTHDCVMLYSRIKHPEHHLPKVIINYIGDIHPYVDDGNAGMQYCQVHYLEHANQVGPAHSVVKSKLWRYLYRFIRYGMHNEKGPLNSFGIPPLTKVYTDAEIYSYYGLTLEEVDLVETCV
jgi:hypothetical protein